jgi:riboflavin synthase
MFTGIIEMLAKVEAVESEGSNRTFTLLAPFDEPIQVDQSIAHDGACLTVTAVLETEEAGTRYTVTAIDETLKKTRLGSWQVGTQVNLERSMRIGQRLDGHFVQGHVDTVGEVLEVSDVDGSWLYRFRFPEGFHHLLVDKGSVTINGTSLTVVEAAPDTFSVAIIPYTYAHTNFHQLQAGDRVNLEFDVLGKYIAKLMTQRA